jgi:hypothetical protein
MIYVASPYWHDDPTIRIMRIKKNIEVKTQLVADEILWKRPLHFFFFPLVYSATVGASIIERVINNDASFYPEIEKYWLNHCLQFVNHCESLFVLQLSGWDTSLGVEKEMARATSS